MLESALRAYNADFKASKGFMDLVGLDLGDCDFDRDVMKALM